MDKNQGNRFGQINGKSKVAVFFVSFRASENARGPDLGHKIPQFIWNTALNGLKMSHFYPLVVCYIATENGLLSSLVYLWSMEIFIVNCEFTLTIQIPSINPIKKNVQRPGQNPIQNAIKKPGSGECHQKSHPKCHPKRVHHMVTPLFPKHPTSSVGAKPWRYAEIMKGRWEDGKMSHSDYRKMDENIGIYWEHMGRHGEIWKTTAKMKNIEKQVDS